LSIFFSKNAIWNLPHNPEPLEGFGGILQLFCVLCSTIRIPFGGLIC
jgi:hypothetical protein